MNAATVLKMPRPASNPSRQPLFADDLEERALYVENFDSSPFQFQHYLHEHPAFQLNALLEAAERLSKAKHNKSHYESGEPDRNAWFGARPEGTTLVQALASIQSGKNWVILKRIHEDQVYGGILKRIIPELSALTGMDIAKVYYDPTMTIFVTSPGRITPYHMDGETNFLAQIHGEKMAYIYDGNSPDVLSQQDMEKYWTGKLPKINYPDSMPFGQWQFTLRPGMGVFNPACFPHWLQNGNGVSVSVSMNFKRRHNATIGAHRMNKYLRRLGMNPKAPGVSLSTDRAKEATFGRLYSAAETLKKRIKG
jgi:hypothetical protein